MKRGIIGAGVQTITPVLAQGLGLGREYGVVVSDVFPRSPASAAGLQVLDVILALDGRPMENGRQFEVNLYGKTIGSEVQLDILRGTDTIRRNVTVVERPDAEAQFIDLTSPEQNLVPALLIGDVETLDLAIGATNIRDDLAAGVIVEVE